MSFLRVFHGANTAIVSQVFLVALQHGLDLPGMLGCGMLQVQRFLAEVNVDGFVHPDVCGNVLFNMFLFMLMCMVLSIFLEMFTFMSRIFMLVFMRCFRAPGTPVFFGDPLQVRFEDEQVGHCQRLGIFRLRI